MGSFYVDITLRGPERDPIVQVFADQKRTAYISPTVGGFTVVYDEECDLQDPNRIRQLTADLSRVLSCPALAISNHDSVVYVEAETGKVVDSRPFLKGR